MKYSREIIRRDLANPQLAEGERVQVEIDPEKVRQALRAFQGGLTALERLLKPAPVRRRRRRRR
jgi:predicted DNA-binding antitoxin AbrB/MazE fold protein